MLIIMWLSREYISINHINLRPMTNIYIYVTKDLFNKIGTLEELTAKKLY